MNHFNFKLHNLSFEIRIRPISDITNVWWVAAVVTHTPVRSRDWKDLKWDAVEWESPQVKSPSAAVALAEEYLRDFDKKKNAEIRARYEDV